MKTTTFAVLLSNAFSILKRREQIQFFGRRVDNSVVKNSATLLIMYMTLFLVGGFIISVVEQLSLSDCLYETASAIGTVGLTLGITPDLGIVSQVILIVLMFLGRVGGLTFINATLSDGDKYVSRLPLEKITVG